MSTSAEKEEKAFSEIFFEKNADKVPVVRIAKIELNGFKSVEHGEVTLECGKQFIPYGTQSDILGIYGQNGSGKTSIIEALAILKAAMEGAGLDESCADCISIKSGVSTLIFTFDLQYKTGEVRTAEYKFSIKKIEKTKEEIKEEWKNRKYGEKDKPFDDSIYDDDTVKYKVCIFDETVKMSRNENGEKSRLQIAIDTSGNTVPFGPSRRLQELIGKDKEAKIELKLNKESLSNESRSFIFSEKTLKTLAKNGSSSIYFDTLMSLNLFATKFLHVIGTSLYGVIGLNLALPIHTKQGYFMAGVKQSRISVANFKEKNNVFSKISTVLSQLVPGLTIELKKLSDTMMSNGKPGYMVIPVAHRNGVEIPLRDESDGVRKIIAILTLIIAAYNDESTTIAIDELDAGVFEYLLGEILQSFEESGKGQLIFTSHNLRPLEVIDKKFLVFTTTNENNRYYRFKDVSATNNLRDKYYREIILGEQDEELYNKTKRFKIESAMDEVYEG